MRHDHTCFAWPENVPEPKEIKCLFDVPPYILEMIYIVHGQAGCELVEFEQAGPLGDGWFFIDTVGRKLH